MSKSINIALVASCLAHFFTEAQLNKELAEQGYPEMPDRETAAKLVAAPISSLDDFATVVVNITKGEVTPSDLTDMFGMAFADSGYKISDKYGSAHLSRVRNGVSKSSIPCRYDIPTNRGKRKRITLNLPDMSDAQLNTIRQLGPKYDRAVETFVTTPDQEEDDASDDDSEEIEL